MVGPSSKKRIVSYLKETYSSSTRAVCQLVGLARSLYYRKSVKDDRATETKLNELARAYPTRGFEWYYLKIRQEGLSWNRKRVLRVYRKLNLGLRSKHKKRINRPYEDGLVQPILPNVTWSVDFMSDALEDGRKIRILNIIDDYNREALATEVSLSFPSARVTRVLDRLAFEHGYPEKLRVDNGPEYTANELKMYCEDKNIELAFIPPGKPHKNGFIERFNRTFREDVLDAYIFESLSQAQITSEQWRLSYNMNHPHQALGGMSPVAFKYARHKVIEAYKQVKAKMNDSLQSSALTCSTSFNEKTCEPFDEKN